MYGILIGIDPGASGSIAHVKLKDNKPQGIPTAVKMPKSYGEIEDYLKEITKGLERPLCIIEKINLRPSDMHGGKAFGMMKLMKNFEYLKAALEQTNIGFIQAHPLTWQNALKLKLKGPGAKEETQTARKNRYKAEAQDKFKEIKCTLWNSDALLLLYFGAYKLQHDQDYIMKNLPDLDLDLLF